MESQGEDAIQQRFRRYHVTKSTKTEERDTISLESRYDARLELLDPTKFRNAAGGVTRRTNRVESAEPPPPNPMRTRTTPRKEQSERRRKGRTGFGRDSDSDSDDDKPKRNRDDDGANLVNRRRVPKSQPKNDLPDLSELQLHAEEQRRLQQLRTLRNVQEKWADIDERRQHYRNEGETRIRQLTRAVQLPHFQRPKIYKGVSDRDLRLRGYLDEMLYGAIRQNRADEANDSTEVTDEEEVVQHVESKMVALCSEFDVWKFSKKPRDERLVLMFEALEKRFWRWLSSVTWFRNKWHGTGEDNEQMREEWREDVGQECARFMNSVCHSAFEQNTSFIDVLFSQYKAKIVDAMSAAVPYCVSDAQLQQGPEGKWLQLFRESRANGRPTPSYVDWVVAGAGADRVKQFCAQRHIVKRKEALREFRENTATRKLKVEQVFCPDLVHPGVVSQVLVKGTHLATVQDVSAKRLESLGWFREIVDGQLRYWRCTLSDYDAWGVAKHIFKMDMDGRVLGAFGCVGSSWVLLEFDCDGRLAPRPLNRVEEEALSLSRSCVSEELLEQVSQAIAQMVCESKQA